MKNLLICGPKKLVISTGWLAALLICTIPNASADPVDCNTQPEPVVITSPYLTVLNLNLAHGRKDAFNQMFQKTRTTRKNLEEIAVFISDSGADLVALQEADFASRWSGKFNHVEFISERSPFPCMVHAHHAKKYMYDFGTALLSTVPYTHRLTHTFEPSWPTTNKGFVLGEVLWNPGGELDEPVAVSVISVHLDFSRKKVREAQTREIEAVLPDLKEPVIILGDFNAGWHSKNSAIKTIVENGNFKVFRPEATDLGTYKSGKHRLDWILISNNLEFVSYEVPQIVLSDHQPILATLQLIDTLGEKQDRSDTESIPDNNHD